MKTTEITQQVSVNTSEGKLFSTWLDSKNHGDMINGSAKIDPKAGGSFSIWDGSIVGKTLEIDENNHKIVQDWRYDYDDWPVDEPSILTITFNKDEKNSNQTVIQLHQTNIPQQYADDIAQGWEDYYWQPMKKYFK